MAEVKPHSIRKKMTEEALRKRIKIELTFFTATLIGYICLYFGLAKAMNEPFTQTTFFETMIVVFLATYLIRSVFVMIRHIK